MKININTLISLIHPTFGAIRTSIMSNSFKYNWKSSIFCMAFLLAMLAYCYIPLQDEDLSNYARYVEVLKSKSLFSALTYGRYAIEQAYVFILLCWIFSRFGGYHMLSAFTTFFIYYIGFYVTCRIGEDLKCDSKSIKTNIFFIILSSNFFGIINNIHNIFAFSIFALAVFRDLYQRKRNIFTMILYIIPCFLHFTAIIFVVLRIIILLPEILKKIFAIILLFSTFIIEFLFNLTSKISVSTPINRFIYSVVKSANSYFFDSISEYAMATQGSRLQLVMKIVFGVMAICFIALSKILNKNIYNNNIRDHCEHHEVAILRTLPFINFVVFTTLACLPTSTPTYWRFAAIFTLLSGIIFLPFRCISYSSRLFLTIKHLVWILAIINFLLLIFRLLAIYDYNSLIVNFITTSPSTEIVKILFNV